MRKRFSVLASCVLLLTGLSAAQAMPPTTSTQPVGATAPTSPDAIHLRALFPHGPDAWGIEVSIPDSLQIYFTRNSLAPGFIIAGQYLINPLSDSTGKIHRGTLKGTAPKSGDIITLVLGVRTLLSTQIPEAEIKLALANGHAPQPANNPADVAGIYFLPTPPGDLRILIFSENSKFESTLTGTQDGHGFVSGSFQVRGHALSCDYFDGINRATANTGCTLIDGHLYLGVGWQPNPAEPDRWFMHAGNPAFFGPLGVLFPNADIVINLKAGQKTGQLALSPPPTGVSAPSPGDAFETVPAENARGEKGFQFLFPPTATSNRLLQFAQKTYDAPGYGKISAINGALVSPMGTFLQPPVPDSLPPAARYDENSFARAVKRLGVFTIKNDVLLTPWTFELGPIGLIPAKVEAKDMLGKWVGESGKRTLTLVAPSGNALSDDMLYTRSGDTLPYMPDARGIVVRAYNLVRAYNPNVPSMNAMSYPGYVVWIPLSRERAACYTLPPQLGGSGDTPILGTIEYFVRSQPAATQRAKDPP